MAQKRLVSYGFLFVFLIVVVLLGITYFDVWIQYIELVTIIGAVSGLIKLIYESNKTRKLKEAEFISNLNRDFTTNDHICHLYEKLEHDYRYPKEASSITEKDVLSFVIYFTFFETLYDFIKKKIVTIENIDDLFGYRFFIMLHNPTIQKNELTADITVDSYVNIFQLYDIWLSYRVKQCHIHHRQIKKNVVMYEQNLYEKYPKFVQYLSHQKHNSKIKRASFIDLFRVYHIQKNVYNDMICKGEKDLFQPSTFYEIYRIYKQHTLFVKKNRYGVMGYIGLLKFTKHHTLTTYVTEPKKSLLIDTVVVDLPYRGLGIQLALLDTVLTHPAYQDKTWYATVAPKTKSLANFEKANFNIIHKHIKLYHDKDRCIVKK